MKTRVLALVNLVVLVSGVSAALVASQARVHGRGVAVLDQSEARMTFAFDWHRGKGTLECRTEQKEGQVEIVAAEITKVRTKGDGVIISGVTDHGSQIVATVRKAGKEVRIDLTSGGRTVGGRLIEGKVTF